MAFSVSKWPNSVSIVSVIVSVYRVLIVNNMLKIRLLYKYSVGCQYNSRICFFENNNFHQFSEITFGIE